MDYAAPFNTDNCQRRIVIGVADMAVRNSPAELLITYSLGSCIAVIIFDPVCKGRRNASLYASGVFASIRRKAKKNPCMFADTGITHLFKSSYQLGARKENIVVKAVGGAQMLDPNGHFQYRQEKLSGHAQNSLEKQRADCR